MRHTLFGVACTRSHRRPSETQGEESRLKTHQRRRQHRDAQPSPRLEHSLKRNDMFVISCHDRSNHNQVASAATKSRLCRPDYAFHPNLGLQEVLSAVPEDGLHDSPVAAAGDDPAEHSLLDPAALREVGVLPGVVPEARSRVTPDLVQALPSGGGLRA